MEPQAPGADAAPAQPAAPVTPPAAEPAAPAAPAAPAVTPPAAEPTPQEAAQAAEDKEWDDAENEIFPGLKGAKKPKEGEKPDEPAKPDEAAKTPEAPKDGEKGDEPPKPDEAGADKDGEQDSDEGEEVDPSRFDARREARQRQQEVEVLKADVRKQMFADAPTEMRDADGDPIKSIEDVMRLVNPRTNQPFTEEEAGMWFLAAQQKFNKSVEDMNNQIDQIANLHQDLHDQVSSINYRYGELLKAMPDVRDRLWTQYERTLVKDEKSGVIVKAPLSLEEFYEVALEPYAQVARDEPAAPAAPAAPVETPEQKAEREKQEKQAEDDKKKKERADRSDIYTGGDKDAVDPEDKEWDEAATAVFGPRKK